VTIARSGLKFKVMGQANAVGLTLIEDGFFYDVGCVHCGKQWPGLSIYLSTSSVFCKAVLRH